MVCFLLPLASAAFYPTSSSHLPPSLSSAPARRTPPTSQEYDLASQQFDLLEFCSFRRETIIQYDLVNRAEVVRIVLYGLAAATCLAWPSIASDLFPADQTDVLSQYLVSASGGTLFGGLAFTSKQSRSRKLRKLELELELGSLSVCQPGNPLLSGSRTSLQALRDRRRVMVLYGGPQLLAQWVQCAAVYRRWWAQSGVVLVAVLDQAENKLSEWKAVATSAEAQGWLYRPSDVEAWQEYLERLLDGRRSDMDGAWLALTLKGRSCASGVGMPPWDELLGTCLPPLSNVRSDLGVAPDSTGEAAAAVLDAQANFYAAIARADEDTVKEICLEADDSEVSALSTDGRLDDWSVVLRDGGTRGMTVSGQNALVGDGAEQVHL